jgi:hypothetical protein
MQTIPSTGGLLVRITLAAKIGLAMVRGGGLLLLLLSVFTLMTAPLVSNPKAEMLFALTLLIAGVGLVLLQRWGAILVCSIGWFMVLFAHSDDLAKVRCNSFGTVEAMWLGVDLGVAIVATALLHVLGRHLKWGL